MDKAKKIIVYFFILVLAVLIICFLMPAQMGRIEVIKTLIEDVCIAITGILFIAISVLLIIQKTKMGYSIVLLMSGVFLAAIGPFGCSNAIKGLQEGPRVIENGNYELDRHSSSYRSPTSYYMIITQDSGRGSIRIKLDKNTYQYLSANTPNVTISYYPYVNIGNEVVYK